MSGFCASAWDRIGPLRTAIDRLPFLTELTDGTLDRERFTFYLAQDSAYLVQYAKLLAAAAALCDDPEDLGFFARAAAGVTTVERELHERYFAEYGLDPAAAARTVASPTCAAYTDHLWACSGSAPVLVAALLPCFWIYAEVGTAVHAVQGSHPENPYRAWIETYADDDFLASCEQAREITDRLAAGASEPVRAAMLAAFVRSSEYEWMFWDSAYRREQWPTARWVGALH